MSVNISAEQPQKPAQPATAKPAFAQSGPQFFETTLTVEQMKGKQAVMETDLGTIIIDLLAEAAPNHVGYFIKNAEDGTYNGTIFHRVVRQGIIQGGDPLTKDPSNQDKYGTGGLGVLRAERNTERNTRGAVAAVAGGGNPDSGGSQFFICIADQPALDGIHDVFGRVSEGIFIAQKISEAAADERGRPLNRIAIRSVVIRDKPAPAPEPFSTEGVAELSSYRAVLETSMGNITLEFMPDKAPNRVRNFLRLVRNLQPEFNDTQHVKGTVSMARGDNPASADASFFISLGPNAALDGKYTAFARVVDGLPVVDAIAAVPVNGETPVTRVEVRRVIIERR